MAPDLPSWTFNNWLVLIALAAILFTITIGAAVIQRTKDEVDLETRKVRFAAATFTGLLMLFVFTAVHYFADVGETNHGKEIIEKAVTAMTPLAGTIVGYLFGTRKQDEKPRDKDTKPTAG